MRLLNSLPSNISTSFSSPYLYEPPHNHRRDVARWRVGQALGHVPSEVIYRPRHREGEKRVRQETRRVLIHVAKTKVNTMAGFGHEANPLSVFLECEVLPWLNHGLEESRRTQTGKLSTYPVHVVLQPFERVIGDTRRPLVEEVVDKGTSAVGPGAGLGALGRISHSTTFATRSTSLSSQSGASMCCMMVCPILKKRVGIMKAS